jgi:hypothetical protein
MNIRHFLGISLLAIVAGCTQTDKPADLGMASDTAGAGTQSAAGQTPGSVVQAACPQVFLRDGTAVLQRYAKGAKDDPNQLAYQATLADTTRRCEVNGGQLVMTVMAQGRIVTGKAGAPGTVTVPIRVAASDGEETLYSELVQFPINIPSDTGASQFVFTQGNIALPGGSDNFVKVYIGFDEGPPKKK